MSRKRWIFLFLPGDDGLSLFERKSLKGKVIGWLLLWPCSSTSSCLWTSCASWRRRFERPTPVAMTPESSTGECVCVCVCVFVSTEINTNRVTAGLVCVCLSHLIITHLYICLRITFVPSEISHRVEMEMILWSEDTVVWVHFSGGKMKHVLRLRESPFDCEIHSKHPTVSETCPEIEREPIWLWNSQ